MRYPVTDHCDGLRFYNPSSRDEIRTLVDVLRWKLTTRAARWPKRVDDVVTPTLPAEVAPGAVAATHVGHATFLLQFERLTVLTDPVFSAVASPFPWGWPRRVRRPALAVDALPPVDVVLVSHNHYDHLDLASLRALDGEHGPLFVTGLGNEVFLKRNGLRQVVELDWWERCPLPGGAEAVYVPAQHFSARGPLDRNESLWGGFVLEHAGPKVYFAADSGYFPGFREIRERLGVPDLALLPIGAYEPRWFMEFPHMNPEDAVRAHLDLDARLSVAMHFGVFQLTDEPIDEPVTRLRRALVDRGVDPRRFVVPGFGETISGTAT